MFEKIKYTSRLYSLLINMFKVNNKNYEEASANLVLYNYCRKFPNQTFNSQMLDYDFDVEVLGEKAIYCLRLKDTNKRLYFNPQKLKDYASLLVDDLINNVFHKNSLSRLNIKKIGERFILLEIEQKKNVESRIFPVKFLKELFDDNFDNNFKSVLDKAFLNFYLFMPTGKLKFDDVSGINDDFSFSNLHMFGLDSNIKDIISNFSDADFLGFAEDYLKRYPDDIFCDYNYNNELVSKLDEFKNMSFPSSIDENYISTTDNVIEKMQLVQELLSQQFLNMSLEEKINLLIYFYCKKFNNDISFENNNINRKKILDIVESNRYIFSDDLISLIMSEQDLMQEYGFCYNFFEIINNDNKRNEILKKYDYLFKIRDYLIGKQLELSLLSFKINDCIYKSGIGIYKSDGKTKICNIRRINKSKSMDITSVSNIMKINDSVDDVENGMVKLDPYEVFKIVENNQVLGFYYFDERQNMVPYPFMKLHYFGLANFVLNFQLAKLEDFVKNSKGNDSLEILNLFKVFDKLLYFKNYNMRDSVNCLHILDMQNINDNTKDSFFMFELHSNGESLFSSYEKSFDSGKAVFVSNQCVPDTNIVYTDIAYYPQLVENFSSRSLLGFVEGTKNNTFSNLIMQKHCELYSQRKDVIEFLNALKDRKIILRYSVGIDMSSDKFFVFNNTQFSYGEELKNSFNVLTELDLLEYSLIGINNVICWLSKLDVDGLKLFCNVSDNSEKTVEELFPEIVFTIYKQIQDNMLSLINKLIDLDIDEMNLDLDFITKQKLEKKRLDLLNRLASYSYCDIQLIDNKPVVTFEKSKSKIIEKIINIDVNDQRSIEFLLTDELSDQRYLKFLFDIAYIEPFEICNYISSKLSGIESTYYFSSLSNENKNRLLKLKDINKYRKCISSDNYYIEKNNEVFFTDRYLVYSADYFRNVINGLLKEISDYDNNDVTDKNVGIEYIKYLASLILVYCNQYINSLNNEKKRILFHSDDFDYYYFVNYYGQSSKEIKINHIEKLIENIHDIIHIFERFISDILNKSELNEDYINNEYINFYNYIIEDEYLFNLLGNAFMMKSIQLISFYENIGRLDIKEKIEYMLIDLKNKYKNLSKNEIHKSFTNLGNVKNLKVYVNLFIAKHFEGKKIK